MKSDHRWFWFENILEQNNSIIYVLKWSFLGITTGIIAGMGVAVFLKLLAWSIGVWTKAWYYYFFIPVILFVNSWLVNWLAPQVAGGSDKVIEAIHRQNGFLHLSEVPVKLVATVITIAAGGSAGKEGPAAQIGATLASAWARFLQVSNADCRKIAICGLSAGFAGVFGTPVAGAIFGVEVLFVGKILYDTLYPAFVAGLTGYYVCRLAGVSYFYLQVSVQPEFLLIIQAIILGLVCGMMAIFFIKTIFWNQRFFYLLRLPSQVKAFVGGIMLTLIGYAVSPLYLGLGLELLETGLRGQAIASDAFLWKTLATGITLGCGGTGGIITPILVVGAVTGNLFGQLFGTLDISVYAVIGMAALLAGAVNTPVAAVLMAAELFGGDIIPYAAISCFVSYLVSEHRSVYPSQVIFTGKRPYLCDDEGKSVGSAGKP
ncbi:chloride channel protein [Sporomusa sp.]|uniref:chloride channel protein n=1 Tax=Sporomusa sp. TaxID=2078658 RepID=UPI002C6C3FC9|nr:chloride channel protein [Sporomusa sp.]HWR45881.1 chloride channel protein [Sporomusa sp.]